MLALHRALLEWLIQGSPPNFWRGGCLHRGIHPSPGTYTGPHGRVSIAAANLLPKGQTRLTLPPPLAAPPVPSTLDTAPMESLLHSPSLVEASLDPSATDKPQWPSANPSLTEGIERPTPYARRTYTSSSSRLLQLFSARDLLKHGAVAKRAQTRRVSTNKGLN